MNEFIKLITNTVYGDIVSPFFATANKVIGNNITERARSMSWYMEKSLHGIQTITDGCCFELNQVVKTRYQLTNSKYKYLKEVGPQKDLSFGKLYTFKIRENDIEELSQDKIGIQVSNHIRKCFPKISIVRLFDIEVKTVIIGIATHGASNYRMYKKGKMVKTKMRSYNNTEYPDYDVSTDSIIGNYNRTISWLNSIYKNPYNVKREEPFVEELIVKTKNYIKQRERLDLLNIAVGDIDYRIRLITECTLSMFTFQSYKQYKSWQEEYTQMRRNYKQSYEAFHTNKEGLLNYKEMIETIHHKIKKGDLKYKVGRRDVNDHPKKEKTERIMEYIETKI
uniref:DNA-directed DNA polymerase n=1 Tax=Corynecladia elata TaxID=3101723 RepID=A0AA51NFI7_9FLOR|nr:hypothetical protein RU988_pgp212 [Laurencia elata]WMP12582.1 hypothetical protein [Laurencia elata]